MSRRFHCSRPVAAALALAACSAAGVQLHVPGDYATIQEAVDVAAAGDTVAIASGSHAGPVATTGIGITLLGVDADSTTVLGNGADPVLTISAGTGEVSLLSLRFTGGYNSVLGGGIRVESNAVAAFRDCAVEANVGSRAGGGIGVDIDASCRIESTSIVGNTSGESGGGLSARNGASVTLLSCEVSSNHADRDGGGLHFMGAVVDTLDGCNILHNSADYDGGGISAVLGASLIARSTVVDSNEAGLISLTGTGGGLLGADDSTSVLLEDCVFGGNQASKTGGGAAIHLGAVGLIDGGTFTGNWAGNDSTGGFGGGVSAFDGSILDLSEVTITDNQAASEGGGAHYFAADGSILDNQICDNAVVTFGTGFGGGVFLHESFSVVQGNTICGNSVPSAGGGVYSQGFESGLRGGSFMLARDNEISANSAETGGGIACVLGDSALVRHNLISGNSADGHGGIGVTLYSTAVIDSNTIVGNTATGLTLEAGGGGILVGESDAWVLDNYLGGNDSSARNGGALRVVSGASVVARGNVMRSNSGFNGAAVDVVTGGVLVLEENLIDQSHAAGDVGALAISGAAVSAVVRRNTILSTVVDGGGPNPAEVAVGVYDAATTEIVANIIGGTTGAAGMAVDPLSSTEAGRNAIANNSEGAYSGSFKGDFDILVKPDFVVGDTLYALTGGSIVVDAGDPADSSLVSGARGDVGWDEYLYPEPATWEVEIQALADTLQGGDTATGTVRVKNLAAVADTVDVVVQAAGMAKVQMTVSADHPFAPGEEAFFPVARAIPTALKDKGFAVMAKVFEGDDPQAGFTQDLWIEKP